MKKNLLILMLLATFQLLQAGNPNRQPKFQNNKDVFGTRVFIENRGQFDSRLSAEYKIYYMLDNGDEKIFFTDKGLVYELAKHYPLTERQMEDIEKGRTPNLKESKIYRINMSWLNSNPILNPTASERQSHYFSYGAAEFNSNTFKKLVYKEVYKNIDIEYTIPEDKDYGVKYNVIVHPGANAADIQIAYSGDAGKMKMDDDGNIVIKTPLNDIIEHAPKSFYSTDKVEVASSFSLEKNVIGFVFRNGYSAEKTLVIDPWVTTVTSLTSSNNAYDVDYDSNGSIYIYGGHSPFKIARYTPAGTLQWTFSGTVVTPAWSSAPIISQASNFAVNKFTSKCYIGQGFVNSGNMVIRIDATGNYDNFVNTANNQFQEVWDMGFHCITGDVFVLGGGTSSNISAVTINPTTAVISLSSFQPTVSAIAQDVVCHAIDDAGNIFVIYAGGQMNNKMCAVNATFNGNLWVQPSTFTVFTEQGNKSQYLSPPNLSSNGFNALAVNANFLYYYDGSNLAAYNKATGAIVASATVPSLVLKKQGGIAVDDCNNVYLGGNGSILTYSFNGTAFSSTGSIPLGLGTSTAQYVYDLQLSKQNKILYVCGSGFVGTFSAANSLACQTATSACFFSIQQDAIICAGESVILTAPNQSSMTNVSYSLQPGPITNSSGTFAVSPNITTTYTLYTTGTNQANVVVTNTSVATVTVFAQPAVAPTLTQTSCTSTVNGFNLNLTFNPSSSSPGYTVTWSPSPPNGITLNSQTSATGGIAPGTYSASIITDGGCSAMTSFTINPIPLPPVFNISPPGGNYLVSCNQPSLEIAYSPAIYSYTTSNGTLAPFTGTSGVFTATNSTGTWTVVAFNPASNCVSTQTYIVNASFTVPNSTVTPMFQNITCSVTSVITVSAYGSPSVNVSHNWVSPLGGTLTSNSYSATFLPGGPGIYTHCLINNMNGCSTCKNFTVTSSSGFPTYSVTSPQNFTLGCTSKSVAIIDIISADTSPIPGGPVSYTIIGPPTSPITPSGILSTMSTYTVNAPGSWTIITKDNTNLCETRVQLSVTQNTFSPDLSIVVPQQILSCYVPSVVLQGQSTTPNVSYLWSFQTNVGTVSGNTITVLSNPSAPTVTNIANYTLTIQDLNNTCISTSVVPMRQNLFPPNPIIAGELEITCNTGTVTLTNMSTSNVPAALSFSLPVVALLWEGPSPQMPLQLATTYVGSMPGAYTMTARDLNNGCISIGTKTVIDSRTYPEINKPSPPDPFVLDCGVLSRTITANLNTSSNSGFTYTWTSPAGANFENEHTKVLTTNAIGSYQLDVYNTKNGCQSVGFVEVIPGELFGDFVSQPDRGYAPLTVNFINRSSSTTGTNNITSFWSFGNGLSQETKSVSVTPSTIYKLPGKYTVTMFVNRGSCMDTVVKYIDVEVPSQLEIPNIFSPNGDLVNDVFFLKTSNLETISIVIYDRWGHKVYDLTSTTGNIAWDGKNMKGKDAAEGVYNYVITASGKDGSEFERKGNVTLVR
jgi:gliding motility-associated-like protein